MALKASFKIGRDKSPNFEQIKRLRRFFGCVKSANNASLPSKSFKNG